jgi:hypothetical protein
VQEKEMFMENKLYELEKLQLDAEEKYKEQLRINSELADRI